MECLTTKNQPGTVFIPFASLTIPQTRTIVVLPLFTSPDKWQLGLQSSDTSGENIRRLGREENSAHYANFKFGIPAYGSSYAWNGTASPMCRHILGYSEASECRSTTAGIM